MKTITIPAEKNDGGVSANNAARAALRKHIEEHASGEPWFTALGESSGTPDQKLILYASDTGAAEAFLCSLVAAAFLVDVRKMNRPTVGCPDFADDVPPPDHETTYPPAGSPPEEVEAWIENEIARRIEHSLGNAYAEMRASVARKQNGARANSDQLYASRGCFAIKILAMNMQTLLNDTGADNYIEMTLRPSVSSKIPGSKILMTVLREGKTPPVDLLRELRDAIAAEAEKLPAGGKYSSVREKLIELSKHEPNAGTFPGETEP